MKRTRWRQALDLFSTGSVQRLRVHWDALTCRELLRGVLSVARRQLLSSARFWCLPTPPDEEPYHVEEPPAEFYLELTSRCNMTPPCSMCGHAAPVSRANWHDMDPAIWQRLLPVLRQASSLVLHGGGEPLLYPHLFPLIGQIDTSRVRVGFNSNGHLLTPEVSRQLIRHGVSWLSISLDAARPETYLRIRRRPDFEQLLAKIRHLVELKAELDSRRPEIEINMTVMGLNLPEAPRFVELAAELGVQRVMFQQIQPGHDWVIKTPDGYVFDYRREELGNCVALHDEMMAQAWERSRQLGLPMIYSAVYGETGAAWPPSFEGTAPQERGPSVGERAVSCRGPWRGLIVNVDGYVSYCCTQQWNGGLLGRADRASWEEIWNGPRARLVRKALLQKAAPWWCRGCYLVSGKDRPIPPTMKFGLF